MTHPILQRHVTSCGLSEAAPRLQESTSSYNSNNVVSCVPHPECFRPASSCSVALFQPWLPLWAGGFLMLILYGSGFHATSRSIHEEAGPWSHCWTSA